jgi:hypothetical protein
VLPSPLAGRPCPTPSARPAALPQMNDCKERRGAAACGLSSCEYTRALTFENLSQVTKFDGDITKMEVVSNSQTGGIRGVYD